MRAERLNINLLRFEAILIGAPITAILGIQAFVASIGLIPAVLFPSEWQTVALFYWLISVGAAAGVYSYWVLLSYLLGWCDVSMLEERILLFGLHLGLVALAILCATGPLPTGIQSMSLASLGIGSHLAVSFWVRWLR